MIVEAELSEEIADEVAIETEEANGATAPVANGANLDWLHDGRLVTLVGASASLDKVDGFQNAVGFLRTRITDVGPDFLSEERHMEA